MRSLINKDAILIVVIFLIVLSLTGCTAHKDINQLVNEQVEASLKANPNLQVVSADGDFVILEEKPKARNVIKHADGSVSIQ